MEISNKKLYEEVLKFCNKNGFIKELNRSLKLSEQKRFNQKKILKFGLDILDAVHCVVDKKRTFLFLKEIRAYTKNKQVLEAGIGTGILSFLAASNGSQVTGLEINKNILKLANEIKSDLVQKKILKTGEPQFIDSDAITFKTKDSFDVIISENIYTGMFYEKQIEIMRNIKKFLKPGGVAIPSEMKNYVQLCSIETSKPLKLGTLLIPAMDKKTEFTLKKLSKRVLYDDINFLNENTSNCSFETAITIDRSGVVNGLLISSEILMPSGRIIKGNDTIFFNNDIFLITKKTEHLKKGEQVLFRISYTYGSKPQDADIMITKV